MAYNYRSNYSGENTDQAIETALGLKPGVEAGKGLSSNDYTTEEKTKLAGIEAGAQVNPDVSMFITRAVDDLVNYYLKSETYTKAEVNALIAGIKQFTYRVVDSLPTASADTMYIVYFVPSADPQAQNVKDEYITVEDNGTYSWELIGSTKIDLGDYAKKTGVYPDMISGASKAVALPNTTEEKFTFKTSGGQGPATIESIKGNSIVWNQIWPSIPTRSSWGVTYTNNGDGSYRVSGTSQQESVQVAENNSTFIGGHKYVLAVNSEILQINIYKPSDAGFNAFQGIYAPATTGRAVLRLRIGQGGVTVDETVTPICIDLTKMFGAGNEPSTVAEFKSLFPLNYYAPKGGKILPFAAQGLKTTGFNLWDETKFLEMGFTKVATGYQAPVNVNAILGFSRFRFLPNTQYTITTKGTRTGGTPYLLIVYTDGTSSSALALGYSKQTIVTAAGKSIYYLSFTYGSGGQNTYILEEFSISLTWSGTRNGEYEPYEEHNLTINPATILDTNGDLIFPYGGMHGVGTAFDEMKPEADGFIHYGTRVWERRAYQEGDESDSSVITDGTTYTMYQLATPVTKELATPIPAIASVNSYGTMAITPENTDAPYTAPMNVVMRYAQDFAEKIVIGSTELTEAQLIQLKALLNS